MKNWIFITFLWCSLSCFAQPETRETETIGGKKYYVHFVQSGNTLYGIHKMYNVSVEEIIKANPGSEKGLNEGQKIIIPVKLETVIHEVAAKETLFGISKKYGVTVDQIIAANPEAENGVKVGQKINIPGVEWDLINKMQQKPVVIEDQGTNQTKDTTSSASDKMKISFSDTIINHMILDHETLYSISKRYMVPVEELQKLNGLKSTKIKPGECLKIPIKKEKVEIVKIREVQPVEVRRVDSTLLFPKRSVYKIAILLPFYLDKGENNNDYITTLATEFYMGAQLAVDSLEKLGLNAEVFVYDSKTDTNTVKGILNKPEFKGMDLIFGPLFPDNVDVVARWCKTNNVRMVCPVAVSPAVLKANPFIYNAVPSDATLMKGLAEFTLKKHASSQVILIKSPNEKDLIMYENYRSTFLSAPVSAARPKLIEATLDNYTSFIKKGVNVVLVFPTNEKSLAVKFMNNLNTVGNKFNSDNIFVFGTKEWVNFDDVKPQFKNKYNFHFASPNDLNYKYSQTEKLHRKYRSAYNADMTKMAVQGFDVMLYFCSDLLLNKKVTNLVMNHIEMVQKGAENGYENSNSFIIQQKDFELINLDNQ